MKYIKWFSDIKKEDKNSMILDLSKIAPKEILTKSGNKTYQLNIAYSGEKVLVNNTKDKHKPIYYPKYIIIPFGKICLWYSWAAGRNQNHNKNKGIRIKYLIVPRYLELNKLTMNTLGLLQAEMTRYTKRTSNIVFSNSEPKLINLVLSFFNKSFRINKHDWLWDITFNYKLKRKESLKKTKIRENLSETYWRKLINLNINRRRKKFIQYTGNKKYFNLSPKTKRKGSLTIHYSNIILYQLILQLLEGVLKQEINLSDNFKKFYLQGLIAGDGCVKLTPFKSVDSVSIGCTDKFESKCYKKLLQTLDISSSTEKVGNIKIFNLRNFIKIYQFRLTELNDDKKFKFYGGLSNFKQIPESLKEEFSYIQKEVVEL